MAVCDEQGIDELKDQSYVLWGLQQDLLKRTLFPLGAIPQNGNTADGAGFWLS